MIDPFLHYHEPLSFLEYPLKDERYQNDGIARHYQYNSIITGTSMSQNFRCSEFDALWDAKSVKMAYSGASFHELNENLRRAFSHQPNIRYVVCSLDGSRINTPAQQDEYKSFGPEVVLKNFTPLPVSDVEILITEEDVETITENIT